MTVYNFSAGPAMLPKPVLEQIKDELYSLNGSGMSILEISHRSQMFKEILDTAKQDVRDLMNVPDNYSVLFCQGGGTGQFAAVPLNLANQHCKIALLDSGHWASGAADEAKQLGYDVDIVGNTKDVKYSELPYAKTPLSSDQYDYLYATINNTIEGTTYHSNSLPKHDGLTLVGDMSSNFMAERYNVEDFGLIYAGAQKNVGPAGVTIVIVRNDLIDPAPEIPSILDYQKYVDKDSMFNTPPTFAIYACGLVLKWIKNNGGVDEMEKRNRHKSQLLYDYLDQSHFYHNNVKKADRSLVNIIFSTGNEKLDQELVTYADGRGIENINGHRTLGGLRTSLYNAMPVEGVEALIQCLKDFAAEH